MAFSTHSWFMSHKNLYLCLTAIICIIMTTLADAAPLPDRYINDPEIGYFGRMSKVLFDANATDTTIATDMIIRKVFGLMDMQSKIKIYENRDQLILDLTENRVDAVFTSVIDHIELEHLINSNYIYTLVYGSRPLQKVYLLTRKNAQIKHISELQGRRISIPKGHYLGSRFLDVKLLKEDLQKSNDFFSQIREVEDTNTAIVELFFGKTDCALVSDIAFELAGELNVQISQELEVLISSNDMVPQIIAINKNVPQSIFDKVDTFLVKSHENKRIKYLLSLFRAKKFVKLEQDQLLETRRLLDEYNILLNRTGYRSDVHVTSGQAD